MAWLTGWSYRKEITITGETGAGTDYQVIIDIGDASGGDFHLEGNCTNFPEDIEVTDNDGETLLKFWIPDKTADPLEMWVKVADDLGSNQTIYVYYGKSGATTNSDISNTFINGWDFEGDTIGNPPAGWTEDDANGDFHVIAGKKVNLLHDSGTANGNVNYASITSITGDNDRIIEFDLEINHADEYNYIYLSDVSTHTNDGIFLSIHADALYAYTGSWTSLMAVSVDTPYHIKVYNIDLTNDQFDIDVNEVNEGTNLSFGGAIASINYIRIEGAGAPDDADSEFDNIIIRKQTSPEPAFSSAGSEEASSTQATTLLHGKIRIKDSTTSLVDGKVQVQDIATSLIDGLVKVQDTATGLSDGLLIVQDKATGLVDGKVQVQDITTNIVDGKVIVSLISAGTDQADGKIQIKDITTGIVDGLIKVKDSVTNLADGKVNIRDIGVNLADGKIQIKDVTAGLADGLVRVKDSVTNLADGKVKINNIGSNLADGLIRIKDKVTGLSDGKIIITEGETSTNLFNGLLRIKDKATGIVDGLLRIIEKPINLADSKIILVDDFNGPFTAAITDTQQYTAVITNTQEYTATITNTQEYTAVIS